MNNMKENSREGIRNGSFPGCFILMIENNVKLL